MTEAHIQRLIDRKDAEIEKRNVENERLQQLLGRMHTTIDQISTKIEQLEQQLAKAAPALKGE